METRHIPLIAVLLAGVILTALVGEAHINPFNLVTSITVDGGDGLNDEARAQKSSPIG